MGTQDIPVFREAQPGQVVRSDDWNEMQQELRNSIRTHRHTGKSADTATDEDSAPQITTDEIAPEAVSIDKLAQAVQDAIGEAGEIPPDSVTSEMIVDGTIQMEDLDPGVREAIESGGEIEEGAIKTKHLDSGAVTEDKLHSDAVTEAKIDSGAVTAPKIAPKAVSISKLSTDVQGRLAVAIARGSVVSVSPLKPATVFHGLGKVPVAVILGVRSGKTVKYPAPEGLIARMPTDPDGTFEVSAPSGPLAVEVVWWAFTGVWEVPP